VEREQLDRDSRRVGLEGAGGHGAELDRLRLGRRHGEAKEVILRSHPRVEPELANAGLFASRASSAISSADGDR